LVQGVTASVAIGVTYMESMLEIDTGQLCENHVGQLGSSP
jgi:hypothetical protein